MSRRASRVRFAGFAPILTLLVLAGCADRNTSIYLPDITPPVVSSVTESGGAVSWQTDEDCTCVLLYGKQKGVYDHYGYNVIDGGRSHHADLIDVPAGKYYFRVSAIDRSGNAATSAETTFTLTTLPQPGEFVYTMVNVGWGDCHFLRFPNGTTVMIDAGQVAYQQAVYDFLNASNVAAPAGITYMVGTHAHADHLGSFPSVMGTYNQTAFLAPEPAAVSVMQYMKADLDEHGIDRRYGLQEGQTSATTDFLNWDPEHGVRVKVLAAGSGRLMRPGNQSDSVNCDSAVLKVSYGEVDFLLTGDAEEFTEDRMIKFHSSDLPCEILKVGHHGNDDATSNIFLNWVRPRVGLISNSLADNDGVFKQSVINLLNSHNVDYYVTDRVYMNAARNAAPQYGNVTVTTDGETYVVSSWK
jgi:competence protein ComEC